MFDVMNNILLIKFPLSVRRIDYTREISNEVENPSKFLRRLYRTSINADLENYLRATTVLPELSK